MHMRVLLFRVFFVIPLYIILNIHFFLVMGGGGENPLFAHSVRVIKHVFVCHIFLCLLFPNSIRVSFSSIAAV